MTERQAVWRTSTFSGDQGDCVQLAELTDGAIGLRDSKHPDVPPFEFRRSEIAAFIAGAKAGEFDDLT